MKESLLPTCHQQHVSICYNLIYLLAFRIAGKRSREPQILRCHFGHQDLQNMLQVYMQICTIPIMNKKDCLAVLRETLDSQGITRSEIARALSIHPSQVSRIAAGKFARMDGHALRICKFAQVRADLARVQNLHPDLTTELQEMAAKLVTRRPEAAKALTNLLTSLLGSIEE
ncbi:helix-turn-helix domain-containing protein [Acidithiobacillus sp.]|uniref:helix-turn-helix domain-containing protein n=1 Tax=Acidithiobacillus sp. TaxID=1872118 RepID=UPI00230EB753|nr:helix-turn-helix domain-containing protein [Acidithiobacillus sp.]MDA8246779.1 helix-turn-helix domain-containing protein [Acidithiobacillus sp.]